MPTSSPVPVFDFSVFMMDAGSGAGGAAGGGAGDKTKLVGAFSEVSGLNAEMDTEEYREGGYNSAPRRFVKWGKYPTLVFKRGITPNSELWDWYYQVVYKAANPVRKNGLVVLRDRGGDPGAGAGAPTTAGAAGFERPAVAVWFFRNALPEKIQGPALNARGNEIAIESLELVHEGLYRLDASAVAGLGTGARAI